MRPLSFDLNRQVTLVVGANRGIGHDLALALAATCARAVAAVPQRDQAPRDLEAVELELGDVGAIHAALDQVRPTNLVNNAGVDSNSDFERYGRARSGEFAPT